METSILSDGPNPGQIIWALTLVLVLLGVLIFVLRRFGVGRLQGFTRGRQPRLGIMDVTSLDTRRKLVIVRRDAVEHLIMIGGPNDVVIETSIMREQPVPPVPHDKKLSTMPAAQSTPPPQLDQDMKTTAASLQESAAP